jgi:hypothetical protein
MIHHGGYRNEIQRTPRTKKMPQLLSSVADASTPTTGKPRSFGLAAVVRIICADIWAFADTDPQINLCGFSIFAPVTITPYVGG